MEMPPTKSPCPLSYSPMLPSWMDNAHGIFCMRVDSDGCRAGSDILDVGMRL